MVGLEETRKEYRKLRNSKIIKKALEEVHTLKPEQIDILKAEIKERDLENDLIQKRGDYVLFKEGTQEEIRNYSHEIRNNTCPECGGRGQTLHATVIGQTVSILIASMYNKRIRVACSKCLDSFHYSAISKSLVLGWWSIPWGPINTLRALSFNFSMKKKYKRDQSNLLLEEFVRQNIGAIEAYKDNPKHLTYYLRKANR